MQARKAIKHINEVIGVFFHSGGGVSEFQAVTLPLKAENNF